MRAAVVEEFGQTPHLVEVDKPAPENGKQVARVRAAALKNIERMLASGEHYGAAHMKMPMTVGLDAVVELDGDLVYTGATPPEGAVAEFMSIDPDQVVRLPVADDPATAAALPNAAVSAWFALEYAGRIEPGQNVLILGATGVTGSLAVQLAKHWFQAGNVIACGRSDESLAKLRERGADDTVRIGDEVGEDFQQQIRELHDARPIDLVLDYLWGPPAEHALRALANEELTAEFHRTRFVQVGEMAGANIELPASVFRSAGVELVGQGAGSVPKEAFATIYTDVFPGIFDQLSRGLLTIDTVTRPLTQVSEAWHEALPSGVRLVFEP